MRRFYLQALPPRCAISTVSELRYSLSVNGEYSSVRLSNHE